MMMGYPTIDSAVNALKEGACDYVTKSFHLVDDIHIKVDRVFEVKETVKTLKRTTGLFRGLIVSIPIWLILGIILGLVWK